MKIVFEKNAKKDFKELSIKKQEKINKLIENIICNKVLGKPLKGYLEGCFSIRVTKKDRLVYQLPNDNELVVVSCKGHYSD